MKRLISALLCLSLFALTACSEKIVEVAFYAQDQPIEVLRCDVGGRVYAPDFGFVGYQAEVFAVNGEAFDFSSSLYGDVRVQVSFYDFSTGQVSDVVQQYQKLNVAAQYAHYGEQDDSTKLYDGEIEQIYTKSGGYYLVVRGNGGVHKQDNPYVRIGVGVDSQGKVTRVIVLDSHAQSEGYLERLNKAFLSASYGGKWATTTIDDEPLIGATVTADTVLQAVRAATNYLTLQIGLKPSSHDEEKQVLAALYSAQYTTLESNVVVSEKGKKLGEVLYAAKGVTAENKSITALIVRNYVNLSLISTEGAQVEWSDSQTPAAHTLAVVIDDNSGAVLAAKLLKDGSKKEWFVLPENALDAYYGVRITSADVFDGYLGGLVTQLPVQVEWSDGYGGYVIAGSSALYTGATTRGTFSSQFLRLCFAVAARYYYACVDSLAA